MRQHLDLAESKFLDSAIFTSVKIHKITPCEAPAPKKQKSRFKLFISARFIFRQNQKCAKSQKAHRKNRAKHLKIPKWRTQIKNLHSKDFKPHIYPLP